MNFQCTDHEVVVVGARCAGAATAMLLARQGHDVLVVDRAAFPSDTLSTHALARGGVVQLARWGLLDAVLAAGTPPVRTVSFHFGDGRVVHKPVKHRAGTDLLVAPRRFVLDTILVDAAVRSGAHFVSGVSVTGVVTDGSGRVTGVATRDASGHEREVRAAHVVGADGVRSRIARAVGAGMIDERASESATHYVLVAGLDAEGFEFHVAERALAGVFPTNDGEANVWVCAPADDATLGSGDRTAAFLELLHRASPALAARVARRRPSGPVRSAVRFPNHVRVAVGRGWSLVGDAGYHRDPITGHGMTDAFRDAELLARRLSAALRGEVSEREALATYARDRYRALAPIFDVTCRLASYPGIDEFTTLQKELSGLIEAEALALAALPALGGRALAAA